EQERETQQEEGESIRVGLGSDAPIGHGAVSSPRGAWAGARLVPAVYGARSSGAGSHAEEEVVAGGEQGLALALQGGEAGVDGAEARQGMRRRGLRRLGGAGARCDANAVGGGALGEGIRVGDAEVLEQVDVDAHEGRTVGRL